MGDALHRPGDAVAYRVVVIEQPKQVIVDDHAGVILAHEYLLRDYPCSFATVSSVKYGVDTKCSSIRRFLFKALGALEVIAGHAA